MTKTYYEFAQVIEEIRLEEKGGTSVQQNNRFSNLRKSICFWLSKSILSSIDPITFLFFGLFVTGLALCFLNHLDNFSSIITISLILFVLYFILSKCLFYFQERKCSKIDSRTQFIDKIYFRMKKKGLLEKEILSLLIDELDQKIEKDESDSKTLIHIFEIAFFSIIVAGIGALLWGNFDLFKEIFSLESMPEEVIFKYLIKIICLFFLLVIFSYSYYMIFKKVNELVKDKYVENQENFITNQNIAKDLLYRLIQLENFEERGSKMKLVIGNDHVAVEMKNEIKAYLEEKGHEVIDVGTNSSDRFNYPISGYKAATMVANGEVDGGILICGTGVGISLSANKVHGIRAVVCSEPYSARLSKQHNNTNILAFGARVIGIELAKMIVDEWLDAEYEGGRHQTRVEMIAEIEEGTFSC